ncbi:predicted protein [Naegleria gruberi]|uniref:Predicted protein n=1 Tax=Naegleria gruberi TaxID=5762 RepID=D2VMQ3_NAEGR|nr:uncharacterized protein NAEGRDRAFT_50824 [Naegleria gruberi]EFC41872.1 predicted protein [Naegleria gruberi]|eukprot:XP_002674616.1 predicted protein [Naegleria gruberi strain NEG-M]
MIGMNIPLGLGSSTLDNHHHLNVGVLCANGDDELLLSSAMRDVLVASKMVGRNGRVSLLVLSENREKLYRMGGLESEEELIKVMDELLKDLSFSPIDFTYLGKQHELKVELEKKESFDVMIGNFPGFQLREKRKMFELSFGLLKKGGEFYYQDIYTDRRLDNLQISVLQNSVHRSLIAPSQKSLINLFSHAMYINDFIRFVKKSGFEDPRELSRSSMISISMVPPKGEEDMQDLFSELSSFTSTYRLFKLFDFEPLCEDYGQVAYYKGSIKGYPQSYQLDGTHKFEAHKPVLVCGNTASVLSDTWLGNHFNVVGNRSIHFGLKSKGAAPSMATSGGGSGSSSCGPCGGGATGVASSCSSSISSSGVCFSKKVSLNVNADNVKLTQLASGLGCGCKINSRLLDSILQKLPKQPENNSVLVGNSTCDDAAVYKINDHVAIVSTIDFFAPIVDNPYDFGAIACANALSDVYAMGGKPQTALSVVAFPSRTLPIEILQEILRGSIDKANEAGVAIVGGHSIDDEEPKFGMSVNGIIHPDKIFRNVGCEEGDLLFLTKRIGTGVITSAMKLGNVPYESETAQSAINSMKTLNRDTSYVLREMKSVSSCTDVTGFGLLGHLKEIMKGSREICEENKDLVAQLNAKQIPLLDSSCLSLMRIVIPGGTKTNLENVQQFVEFASTLSKEEQLILADAQTSGGLLFTISPDEEEKLVNSFKEKNLNLWKIGEIVKKPNSVLIQVLDQ